MSRRLFMSRSGMRRTRRGSDRPPKTASRKFARQRVLIGRVRSRHGGEQVEVCAKLSANGSGGAGENSGQNRLRSDGLPSYKVFIISKEHHQILLPEPISEVSDDQKLLAPREAPF